MFRFDCFTTFDSRARLYKKLFDLINNGVLVGDTVMISSIVFAVDLPRKPPLRKLSFNYFAVIDATGEVYRIGIKNGVSTAIELSEQFPDRFGDDESWIQFLHRSGLVFASGYEYLYDAKGPITDTSLIGSDTSPFNLYYRRKEHGRSRPRAPKWDPVTESDPPLSDQDYREVCYHDKETSTLYWINEIYNHPGITERFREDYKRHVISYR